MTMFKDLHPGGEGVIMQVAGKDATQEFYGLHRHSVLVKYAPRLIVGVVQNETPKVEATLPGSISHMPYAEQSFWRGYYSPYFDESHKRLRVELRKFVETKVLPEALEFEEEGKFVSKEVWKAMAEVNIHAARMGPGKHLQGRKLLGGITPQEFNYFHEAIFHEELVRMMTAGYNDGLGSGMVIGLPPLLNYGTAVHQPVVKQVLDGEKWICLAISEAVAGSDVAGIQTRAKLSDDGTHFIVNGTKKWITSARQSDYFTTAVRTEKGFTMLLIPRGEGVETKAIKTSYSASAGTAFITYDNVKVPVENVLGKVDKGFAVIMSNFNHERWVRFFLTTKLIG
jgi:alkylation response protein AidB-like acyl-CoA dehydrogenase